MILKKSTYIFKDQEYHIKNWILKRDPAFDNLLSSFFISLLTGVPEFLVRSRKYTEIKELMRYSSDSLWDKWTKTMIKNYSKKLFYEEVLTLEFVNSTFYETRKNPNFKLSMDVGVGEFDKAILLNDKIKIRKNILLSANFLWWIRTKWVLRDPRKKKLVEKYKEMLGLHVEKAVSELQDKMILKPWSKKNFIEIVVHELLKQLSFYDGPNFSSKKMLSIPLEVHFGPFALKYLYYKYRFKHNRLEIML